MKRHFGLLAVAVAAIALLTIADATAQVCGSNRYPAPSYRSYWGYPYSYSYGYRVDPYWSYSSTRQPYAYHGDGSYYGLGYSGYGGNGSYGNYWYW